MSSRRTAMGVAVWAAVVLVGSTLVWVVISRVGAEASHQVPAAQPSLSSAAEPTKRPRSDDRPRSTPTRPSGDRSSPAGATGADEEPTEQSSDGPPGSPASSSSAPASTGSGGGSSPGVPRRTDTWSGSPGTVRATCRGTTLVDWSASPDLGWKLETEWEDSDLRAKFEKGDDGREVEVTVTCASSRPRFLVQDES